MIPYVSPGGTVEEAAKFFNLGELLSMAKQYEPPPSGQFRTLEDLDGVTLAGPPAVIVEQVRAYQAVGIEHFLFDFRTSFERYKECVEIVGEAVLPLLHRGDGRA